MLSTTVFDLSAAGVKNVEEPAGIIILKALKDAGRGGRAQFRRQPH